MGGGFAEAREMKLRVVAAKARRVLKDVILLALLLQSPERI